MARRRGLLPSATPAAVRAVVLAGERVLGWAPDAAGRPVVASTAALYLPAQESSDHGHERLPYEQIAAATWDEPTLEVVTIGPRRRRFVLRLDDFGLVPEAVRDRVTASIVVSEHVPLIEAGGARITARRAVVGTGEVTWHVVFDAGLDPADPELREAADAAIVQLRRTTGL